MKHFSTLALFALSILVQAQSNIIWQNTVGGTGEDDFTVHDFTTDGGFITAGYSNSDSSGDKWENSLGGFDWWIIKWDATGQSIDWQRTIGDGGNQVLAAIHQTPDGGYIVGGHTYPSTYGLADYWLVRLDANGADVWQQRYGGSGDDFLYAVEPTTNGGYILGGRSNSFANGVKTEPSYGGFDYWVLKVDDSGDTLWQNTIGGNADDYLFDIEPTVDSGYLLCGKSASNSTADKSENSLGGDDYWVVKLDGTGTIVWENTIGGADADAAGCVRATNDGGCLVGGFSNSPASIDKSDSAKGGGDFWIVRLDDVGSTVWESTIGGDSLDELGWIEPSDNGSFFLGGNSNSQISGEKTDTCRGGRDYWIVEVDSMGNPFWQVTLGGSEEELLYYIQERDGKLLVGGRSVSDSTGDKTEDSNGGVDHWMVYLEPDLGTAVSEQTAPTDAGVVVFPNPADDHITVKFNATVLNDARITIRDAAGREAFAPRSISGLGRGTGTLEIPVAHLSPGAYFVTLQGEQWQAHGRFIKE